VDNRAGGGGTIAINIVAKSDADGYTLLAVGPGITYAAQLYKKLPFDVKRDLAPVAFMASQPFMLVVNLSVPAQSVTELIRFAKSRPEQVRFGSGGVGGASHLVTELFRTTADVNIVHVPYKGTGPGMTALLGGEIHMLIVGVPTAQPHVAAGRIKALAITGSKRVPGMAEVPTIAEAGLPGAEVDIWVSLFAPAKTPRALLVKVNRDVNTALQSAQARRSFDAAGAVPQAIGLDEFNRYMGAETVKWSKVIHSTGIRAE
jgi:tripartite-type tricarboxylate transporter receptor subunit TctC